ncbi:MAG: NAD-dependent epimerase/dehydratase family protein [Verrucomicrobiales bacterium]
MKVLVTGGAGYIGSVATERLISNGYEVVVLDSFYMGHREAVHPQAAFVEADLSDKAAVDAAFREHRPEAVMHFASHTLVGESMQHPFLYLGDNVRNALNLLEVMVEHGVGKIILSSTANLFEKPESMPIGPDERVIPGSPYGESKAIIERFLHWLQVTKGLRYACLRYFNAAGATAERVRTIPRRRISFPWCCRSLWGSAMRSKFSAGITRLPMAPACGTTSTSPILPMPTS